MARMDACPTAGCTNRKQVRSTLCWPCHAAEKRRASEARRACRDCGGPTRESGSERCDPCARAARRTTGTGPVCACGGRKISGAKHCRACEAYARHHAPVWRGILRTFDAKRFRRMIEAADMEWSPQLIEEATGGRLPRSSIAYWLRGERKPTLAQWGQIRRVLALEPCATCGGLGYTDGAPVEIPTARPMPSPVPVSFPTVAPGPIAVGGLALSPGRGEVTFGGRTASISRRETQVLAALMQRAGRPVRGPELVAAVFGRDAPLSGEHAIRIVVARLRARLRPIGAADLIVSRVGYGWRIEPDAVGEVGA